MQQPNGWSSSVFNPLNAKALGPRLRGDDEQKRTCSGTPESLVRQAHHERGRLFSPLLEVPVAAGVVVRLPVAMIAIFNADARSRLDAANARARHTER